MARSTPAKPTHELKQLRELLELLRASGVRRYRSGEVEIELDPPVVDAGWPALGEDGEDLPTGLRARRTKKEQAEREKLLAERAARRRGRTVMEEPDLYADGEVPMLPEGAEA